MKLLQSSRLFQFLGALAAVCCMQLAAAADNTVAANAPAGRAAVGSAVGTSAAAGPAAAPGTAAASGSAAADYRLAPGDAIRIQVFQNPDLSLETRVPETGAINYPLVGAVPVGGLTITQAEQKIAAALRAGGYVAKPQVNIVLQQVRGNQVSVLGQVNHPGRFPLETFNVRVSEVIALAGGVADTGASGVVLVGVRDGKPFRKEIDLDNMFSSQGVNEDMVVAAGDTVYVNRAPVFYIYGEVQKPGSYRIERGMTVQQALAQGGGLTPRGTERRLRLERKGSDGQTTTMAPKPVDLVQANDVLYVRESLF